MLSGGMELSGSGSMSDDKYLKAEFLIISKLSLEHFRLCACAFVNMRSAFLDPSLFLTKTKFVCLNLSVF